MDTMELMKKVEKELRVLDLPPDKMPSLKDFKKEYKDKLYLHPEAARHIMELITDNPNLHSKIW